MAGDDGTEQRAERGLVERLDDLLVQLDALRERRGLLVAAAGTMCVVVALLWWFGRPATSQDIDELIPRVSLEPTQPTTPPLEPVVVHVAGAVRRPGVFELASDERVLDAIEAAGGPLDDADLNQLNLAAPLSDGVQIRVPFEGEILPASNPTSGGGIGPVDLNRAGVSELEALPGVGPATAAAITSWRDDNGPFRSVDDLLSVPGIGPAKLAAIADLVVVR